MLAAALTLPAWGQATAPDARAPASTGAKAGKPAAAPAAPRQRIELTPAERQALDRAAAPPASAPVRDELVPTEADAKAVPPDEPATRIEQVWTSNRISEIRVTPALTGRTYTINNREGQQPMSATDTSSGLSLPKFFTFEFGRPAERPTPGLPPPPSSTTR